MKNKILNLIESFPAFIEDADEIEIPSIKDFEKARVVGMGGSYISGLVIKKIVEGKFEVEVCNYPLNKFNDNELIILVSYSGETKEVLESFKKIKNTKRCLVITSGGDLLKKARSKNIKIIKIPENLHQRFTIAYSIVPLIKIFQEKKAIKKNFVKEILSILNKNKEKIRKESKKVARKLKYKLPLFYSTPYFYPIAYRLQTSLEEDAKILCHSNLITELFHNELETLPSKIFYPVLIIDKQETRPFSTQIKFFKKYIKNFYEFPFENFKKEERMFLCFYFADFLGYYLSLIKKTKMGETPISDKIKKLK